MKKIILFATAALALAACSNDDDNLGGNNGPVEARITAGVSGPTTRAIDNQWEADEIGVMVKSVTGTTTGVTSVMADMYQNVKYATLALNHSNPATFAPVGASIFFQDANETVTFSAYGPYQPSAVNALPGTGGVIYASTAMQRDRTQQQAFDYIFATGATASRRNPTVEFKGAYAFKHKMSRLIIVVKPGDDVRMADLESPTKFALNGLKHNGEFNVITGEATATGDASDWSLTGNSFQERIPGGYSFTSIVYPQILSSALTFKATIDGQNYVNNSAIRPALKAGMSYTYTITVKKTGMTVSGCTIENWGDGGIGSGDATLQ